MKASKKLEKVVKEVITNNNGEFSLRNTVTIKSEQYTGFNYDTNEHEYVTLGKAKLFIENHYPCDSNMFVTEVELDEPVSF